MVVHEENAGIAYGAVVGAQGLDVVAGGALLPPARLQLGYGLAPVSKQSLDVLADSLEPVVLHVLSYAVLHYCLGT